MRDLKGKEQSKGRLYCLCGSVRFKESEGKFNNFTFNDLLRYLSDKHFFSLATKMSRYDLDPAGSVINWPPGSAIQDYRSRIRI